MAVFRVEKNGNYTVMCNCHLRDTHLSLKAKGLLSMFLSFPEDWEYSINGLASICMEGPDSIRAGLVELEKRGYVTRERIRDARGRLRETLYTIYEAPHTSDHGEPEEDSTGENPAGDEDSRQDPRMPEPEASGSEDPDLRMPDPPMSGAPVQNQPTLDFPAQGNSVQNCSAQKNPSQLNKDIPSKDRSSTDPNQVKREGARVYGSKRNVFLSDSDLQLLQTEFPSDWQSRIEYLSTYMAESHRLYPDPCSTIRRWALQDQMKHPSSKQTQYSRNRYDCEEGESL